MIGTGKLCKVEEGTEIIEYIAKETIDVRKMQELISKIH
jgi:hypothetical protein